MNELTQGKKRRRKKEAKRRTVEGKGGQKEIQRRAEFENSKDQIFWDFEFNSFSIFFYLYLEYMCECVCVLVCACLFNTCCCH